MANFQYANFVKTVQEATDVEEAVALEEQSLAVLFEKPNGEVIIVGGLRADFRPVRLTDDAVVSVEGFRVRAYASCEVYEAGGDWYQIELVNPSLTDLSRVLRTRFGPTFDIEVTAEEAAYLRTLIGVDDGENAGDLDTEDLHERLGAARA